MSHGMAPRTGATSVTCTQGARFTLFHHGLSPLRSRSLFRALRFVFNFATLFFRRVRPVFGLGSRFFRALGGAFGFGRAATAAGRGTAGSTSLRSVSASNAGLRMLKSRLWHSSTACHAKTLIDWGRLCGRTNNSSNGLSGWHPSVPGRAIQVPSQAAPFETACARCVHVALSPCAP
jgi:hypothetical protein